MENNDVLVRLRYALEIKNSEMSEIFKLGGMEVPVPDVVKILKKSEEVEDEYELKLTNSMLNSFLNGFIIYKRGKQEPKPGQPETPEPTITNKTHVNNVLLKRVKIALSLTTEDMLEIFKKGGLNVSKGELGAILRKEGHKNYKPCLDSFARAFLKGLAVTYRDKS
ncbi:DUF1456 family protein [Bacillus sp. BGMRC 2118]|nr:DUF1456 family protein [Bacillus sp. BGMRC 2118]